MLLDEETINIIIAAVIPLFIGYLIERRYNIIERRHYVRIQFELEAKLFGPQKGNYIAELTVILNNKGLVRHKIDALHLEVLGIEHEKEIEVFKKEIESIKKKAVLNSVASFLDKILKTNMVQNKEKKIEDDERKNLDEKVNSPDKILKTNILQNKEKKIGKNTDEKANFPDEIVKSNMLKNKGTFFVEPRVVQRFSYVTIIPEETRFILVRSSFEYHKKSKHSAQKMFEIKSHENKKVTEIN